LGLPTIPANERCSHQFVQCSKLIQVLMLKCHPNMATFLHHLRLSRGKCDIVAITLPPKLDPSGSVPGCGTAIDTFQDGHKVTWNLGRQVPFEDAGGHEISARMAM